MTATNQLMKVKNLIVLAFLLFVATILTLPFTAAAATTYVADSFTRTVTDGWGSTTPGGTYTLSGTAANFDIPGQVGMIKVPSANKMRSALLNSVMARDVDFKFRLKRDKTVAGGVHIGYFLARQVNGNGYLARIRYAKDGSVRLQAMTHVGGVDATLGGEKVVPGVTNAAGAYLWVRGQVTGVNPTTVRMKAWALGAAEPGWQYMVTDATASLQAAGAVGLQAYLGTGATNAPVIFYYDDFSVTAATSSAPTPTPLPPTPTSLPPTPTPAPSTSKIYWGALVNGRAPDSTNLAPGGIFDTFEQRAGKRMSILHWGSPWYYATSPLAFQKSYFDAVRARGSIPLVDWGSWNVGSGVNQVNFQLADIYGGKYDSYITQWAQAAKAWGHPFFLRFDWEMNGDWQFPWSEQINGNQPGDYVKMWRHVHDIFTQQGVTNVSWVWCPNVSGGTTVPMSGLYPGDAYVDWTCLDGYNKYTTWLNFEQVFNAAGINWLGQSYNEITNLAPGKPLMLGEFASQEAGDGGAKKAAWLQDMLLTQLPAKFPKIKAVVYFNWNDGSTANSFPIESSPAATDAFKQGISASVYPANVYSNLNTSPIPAP